MPQRLYPASFAASSLSNHISFSGVIFRAAEHSLSWYLSESLLPSKYPSFHSLSYSWKGVFPGVALSASPGDILDVLSGAGSAMDTGNDGDSGGISCWILLVPLVRGVRPCRYHKPLDKAFSVFHMATHLFSQKEKDFLWNMPIGIYNHQLYNWLYRNFVRGKGEKHGRKGKHPHIYRACLKRPYHGTA